MSLAREPQRVLRLFGSFWHARMLRCIVVLSCHVALVSVSCDRRSVEMFVNTRRVNTTFDVLPGACRRLRIFDWQRRRDPALHGGQQHGHHQNRSDVQGERNPKNGRVLRHVLGTVKNCFGS